MQLWGVGALLGSGCRVLSPKQLCPTHSDNINNWQFLKDAPPFCWFIPPRPAILQKLTSRGTCDMRERYRVQHLGNSVCAFLRAHLESQAARRNLQTMSHFWHTPFYLLMCLWIYPSVKPHIYPYIFPWTHPVQGCIHGDAYIFFRYSAYVLDISSDMSIGSGVCPSGKYYFALKQISVERETHWRSYVRCGEDTQTLSGHRRG